MACSSLKARPAAEPRFERFFRSRGRKRARPEIPKRLRTQMQSKEERRSPPARSAPAAPEHERASPGTYRILIVDDHPVVRRGLRSLLAATQADIEVAEASSGAEALEQVKKIKPDLV